MAACGSGNNRLPARCARTPHHDPPRYGHHGPSVVAGAWVGMIGPLVIFWAVSKSRDSMLQTFERRKIDPHRLYGLVVSESDTLVLIQREDDFEFDGYIVIRRRDISKSFAGESNAYCEQLMRREGLWKTPTKAVRSLPLADWQALLSALSGKTVIIENERKGDFFIGPIVSCDARSAMVHYFDACGQWREIERVPYRTITSVQFGCRYATVHSRYLPPRNRKIPSDEEKHRT
jgi:hypothetical protein